MKPTSFWPMALLWAALACPAQAQPVYNIETVAGSSPAPVSGLGGAATAARLGNVQGVATDRLGNLYLSDTNHNRVLKVDTSGAITAFAGTGIAGFSGDGGPATAAQLSLPYGLAADVSGNLYVADYQNSLVRRIAPDGTISTVAGGGTQADAIDGSPATSVPLLGPRNLAVDAAGNLYVSEFNGGRVRKVDSAGNIWTVAGTGVPGNRDTGGLATNGQLSSPAGLGLDPSGNLYIADSGNSRICVIKGGIMSAIEWPATVLGGPAIPVALAVDTHSTIYAGDGAGVLSYTQAGIWSPFAGVLSLPAGVTQASFVQGYSGDGGLATSAELNSVLDLTVSPAGTLYIADSTYVRSVDRSLIIRTVAGSSPPQETGDGGPATSAVLSTPSAMALDHSGNLSISDTGFHRVRQVTPSGTIATVAGTGFQGYNGDGIPATKAHLNNPRGVALDKAGNLVIADMGNQRIRRVTGGVISTVIGLGAGIAATTACVSGPLQTAMHNPTGICYDLGGNLYVVDQGSNRVLQVPLGGLVVVYAGQCDGTPGSGAAGDGGLARAAHLNTPTACATDASGNLYIADTGNHRIRKVTQAGIISTVAGTGLAGASGDEGPATNAALDSPLGVAVDGNGNVFINDTGNNRIRMVTADGVIHGTAGTGAAGFAGDGGSAQIAQLFSPAGLALDGSGNAYVADAGNNRVRRLMPQAVQQVAPPVSPVSPTQPASGPVVAVENTASMAQGPVAPGELVTIVGTGLGPQAGVAGALNSSGLVATLLAGTEVDFGGVPSPVLYTQNTQVTAQVPYAVAGNASTQVAVLYLGQTVGAASIPLATAAPGLFPQVLNQDGSANSAANPAPPGSTVILYGTGEGLRNGSNIAGLPAAAPYASPLQPVVLTIGGAMASIAFSGAAPGQVGVLQVNAVVPDHLPSGQNAVVLAVGG
ncbi:MAG TPA: IPT/TIG domain-containing protein, partial [Bryobacteraceae bacterium]|nr:IPT/TIG domain-containing protein [Bryobacteraceae bacterium]